MQLMHHEWLFLQNQSLALMHHGLLTMHGERLLVEASQFDGHGQLRVKRRRQQERQLLMQHDWLL